MPIVNVLDMSLANKIAAGEVVERPASVVKELVENSIDAGCTSVSIEIADGGLSYIRVSDNGCGMDKIDAKTAFLRHATSKITSEEQLYSIATLGFRGEALASIAAVSTVTLKTHMKNTEFGTEVRVEYGKVVYEEACGCPDGTSIEVTNLFANVPARLKFVRNARAEAANVSDYVLRMILSRPDIAIRLTSSGKILYQSRGDGNLKNAIYCAYGYDIMSQIVPIEYSDDYVRVYGYIGLESISRPTRVQQSFFANGRYIRSIRLSGALQSAYDTRIMVGRFPVCVINIEVAPTEIDVNVHPNKLEVRFRCDDAICHAIRAAARQGLGLPRLVSMDTSLVETPKEDTKDTSSAPEITAPTATNIDAPTSDDKADDKSEFADDFERLRAFLAMANSRTNNDSATQTNTSEANVKADADTSDAQAQNDESLLVFAPDTASPEAPVEQLTMNLDPFEVLCSVFDSFWLVRQSENIFIIDQHAMHERVLYESLIKGTIKSQSQMLLVPIIVKLTPKEYAVFAENVSVFYDLGFDIEEFGVNTLKLTAVPHVFGKTYDERFLHDAIADLENGNSANVADIKRDIIIKASCKAAIKLGNIVPKEMISDLLEHYKKDGIPLTCPHGRPVLVVLTKKALLKMFKRIV